MLPAILGIALKLLGGMLAMFVVIAMGDAFYQRFRWRSKLRMTKEEMKQEHKESEGNPEGEGPHEADPRLAGQQAHDGRRPRPPRSFSPTPPTMPSPCATKPGMAAPICVAKGVDSLALRIRAVAKEHDVPIMENPPLARALHATVEIDSEIPAEHYRAVAEVIGFVMRLKRRAA